MKSIWTLIAIVAITSPLAAAPSTWTSGVVGGVHEYRVGTPGNSGTSMVLSCPAAGSPFVTVQINGVLPPSGKLVGFKAAGRALAIRSADSGSIKINTDKDRTAFRSLWSAVRAGSVLTISFPNGVTASLPLKGSARALPANPC